MSFVDSFIQDGANLDTKNELGFKRNTNVLIDDPDYWIAGYEMISKLVAPRFIRVIIMNAFKISKHMEIIKMLGDFNCQSCIYENFLRQLVLICPYLINEPDNNLHKPYEYESTPADCVVTLLQLNLEQLNIISQSTTSKFSSDETIMSKIVSVDKLIEDFLSKRVLESDKNIMSLNLENAVDGVLNTLFSEQVKWCSSILMEKLFEKFHLFKYFEFMHSYFLFKSNEIMFLFSKSLFDLLKLYEFYQEDAILNNLFYKSASSVFTTTALIKKFPFNANSVVVQYGDKAAASNASATNASRLINKVSLKMNVKWPLNIIIKPNDLDTYNMIFLFIMQLKQAKYELDSLDLKELDLKRYLNKIKLTNENQIDESSIKKAFSIRFKLMNFINNAHDLICNQVNIKKKSLN